MRCDLRLAPALAWLGDAAGAFATRPLPAAGLPFPEELALSMKHDLSRVRYEKDLIEFNGSFFVDEIKAMISCLLPAVTNVVFARVNGDSLVHDGFVIRRTDSNTVWCAARGCDELAMACYLSAVTGEMMSESIFRVSLDYPGLSRRVQDSLTALARERRPGDDGTMQYVYCMQLTERVMAEVRARRVDETDPWPGVLVIANELADCDVDIRADEHAVALLTGLR